MKRKILFLVLPGLTPLLSMGHPGHGENGGFTITHYIAEPIHVFTGILLLSVSVAVYSYLKRKAKPANHN